jgi:hypothetical protein
VVETRRPPWGAGYGWVPLQDGARRLACDQWWDRCAQAWRPVELLMVGAIYDARLHPPHRRRADAPTRRDPLGVWTPKEVTCG